METKLVTDFNRIEHIYNTFMKLDFPSSELKPLASIRRMWEHHSYDCYEMTENDDLTGYAFYVKLPSGRGYNYLLDYLAVVDGYRDRGYGSELLKQLYTQITDAENIVVEVEDPDKAEDKTAHITRQRRMSFYLRNGFAETGITATVFSVPFRILLLSGSEGHSVEEIREIYTSLYKYIVPDHMYADNIIIS